MPPASGGVAAASKPPSSAASRSSSPSWPFRRYSSRAASGLTRSGVQASSCCPSPAPLAAACCAAAAAAVAAASSPCTPSINWCQPGSSGMCCALWRSSLKMPAEGGAAGRKTSSAATAASTAASTEAKPTAAALLLLLLPLLPLLLGAWLESQAMVQEMMVQPEASRNSILIKNRGWAASTFMRCRATCMMR